MKLKTNWLLKFLLFCTLILTCGFFATSVHATDLSWSKNKFGLHINSNIQELENAASLLNTNGGDWSWVVSVIRSDELNLNQWQDFFNQCRRLHLIPIIRVATNFRNGVWTKPTLQEIEKTADFLGKLRWPATIKLVIGFNEPNRASEWGGEVSPRNFYESLEKLTDLLHKKDKDFFILHPGLDLAAIDKKGLTMAPESFYHQGYLSKPEIFEKIDGLASHSYPNYGFVGLPTDQDKTSILGYRWETNYLKELGVTKKLPVFITETGWPHAEGVNHENSYFPLEKAVQNLLKAFDLWSQDPDLYCFCPFILNFPHEPFDHFSWTNQKGEIYQEYQVISKISKQSQKPPQEVGVEFVKISFPLLLKSGRNYPGEIILKNTGESIWGEGQPFCLSPKKSSTLDVSTICLKDGLIEPNQDKSFQFVLNLPEYERGNFLFGWEKTHDFEIKNLVQIYPSETIYRRKTGIGNRILKFFRKLLF